jgi:uncharacterized membrane protein
MAAKEELPIVEKPRPEPRWPAVVAILTTGLVYAALPRELSFGPRWLMFVIVAALAGPNVISHHRGKQQLNNLLGYFTASVVTIFLLWSVALLVRSLPRHEIEPVVLLRSAVMLWICNVVIFALWYWRLDGGGPYARQKQGKHERGAFLFPPMTNDGRKAAGGHWSPRFVDYLFLSFNTSTAFSPTDTSIISRWAKVLVMIQSLLALSIVVVLAARAVNIL